MRLHDLCLGVGRARRLRAGLSHAPYKHPTAGALFVDVVANAATHFEFTFASWHREVDANADEGTAAIGCDLAEIDEIDLLASAIGEILQLIIRFADERNR